MQYEGSGSAAVPQPSCPVSLRWIAVTNVGPIRQHGPVVFRCPGFHHLPSYLASALTVPQAPPSHQCHWWSKAKTYARLSPLMLFFPQDGQERPSNTYPKASRECAVRKFAAILGAVVDKNDHTSWVHLLRFSSRCLGYPVHGEVISHWLWQLTDRWEKKLTHHLPLAPAPRWSIPVQMTRTLDWQHIGKDLRRVISGGLSGWPVRRTHWSPWMRPHSKSSRGTHTPTPDSIIPSANQTLQQLTISGEDVIQAILSFPKSSAGGPDGLSPQYLKDMLSDQTTQTMSYSLQLFPPCNWYWKAELHRPFGPTSLAPTWLLSSRWTGGFALLWWAAPSATWLLRPKWERSWSLSWHHGSLGLASWGL